MASLGAQLWVNGPAAVQVGTGSAGALQHLGFTENGVRISFDAKFEDIHTDISGPMIPHDVQMMGEQAYITLDMNKFDEVVLEHLMVRMATATYIAAYSSLPGRPGSKAIGTLMQTESAVVRLLINAPYASKAVFFNSSTGDEMPLAYNFPTCYPMDAIDLDPVGLRVKKVRIIMRAVPAWDPPNYAYTLYNGTATGQATVT